LNINFYEQSSEDGHEKFYRGISRLKNDFIPQDHPGFDIQCPLPKRDPNKKTAYVIGTGPSLRGIDMSLLRDKKTITFNRAYIAFEDWGFDPSYYMCIDCEDIKSIGDDVSNLIETSKIEHFFLPDEFQIGHGKENVTLLQNIPEAWAILHCLSSYIYMKDRNLIITNLMPNAGWMGVKMLYLMGYSEVALLGCDARYRVDDESQRSIVWDSSGCVSEEDYDVNHFRDDYFGKGQRFGRPIDEDQLKRQWTQLKAEVDVISHQINAGVNYDKEEYSKICSMNDFQFKVYSCSEGSNLNSLFPYIPFEEFVAGKR
tara:strand:+ start:1745 stop:2686 length:942 start_codon:yes stop_codon:yes gene_type:complete